MCKAAHAQMENLKIVLLSEEEMMLGLQYSAWSQHVHASCSWTQCGKCSSGAARKGTEAAMACCTGLWIADLSHPAASRRDC